MNILLNILSYIVLGFAILFLIFLVIEDTVFRPAILFILCLGAVLASIIHLFG
jgi:hypothetical protein